MTTAIGAVMTERIIAGRLHDQRLTGASNAGALSALARLSAKAGNDNDLTAECRRWWCKLAS